MKISPIIKKYKKAVGNLNAKELLTAFKNSRLSTDERFVVELVDLYGKSLKEASYTMDADARQINRWLHKARAKIYKQIFK
ncbi:MAG: hypothetical protein J5601_03870 [Elusimicrobiaceae bacterium]|nr:hypothetical protein [Elusimicrobiaceae bacterium]